MGRYRVSMDIGGTFTDVVAYREDGGTYAAGKASTTPRDPTEGVFAALAQVVDVVPEIGFFVHGTTVGLNAFLQRRGERVLLLATEGVGDTYQIARGNRTKLYELHYRKPAPLVGRRDTVEIGGRLDWAGEELTPLDEEAVRAAARRAESEAFGAVAVCFLFSYLNPEHELRAEEILRDELGDLPISLSHRVAAEWREYERTSTAVLDAYTGPAVRGYLERLERQLEERGLDAPLHVMQSSGGVVTARSARERPVQTLLSGPVGGSMGLVALARLLDRPNLIGVDMGGTSFDVSLVINGRPEITTETSLEGLPLLMPIVNIHTVGAGGGSLAYEEGGGLRVGPQSAGADPGPVCYRRGGTQPTVTDANLVLGRIDAESFAGGTMSLDTSAAASAIAGLAKSLSLEPLELAEGILDVINAKMAQAIRTLTVAQGIEPRDFALVAFGGAGPMHAAFLAEELEIAVVVVPRFPGAFSAWGMLETDLRRDFSRSFYAKAAAADLTSLAEIFRSLEAEGRAALADEGVAAEATRVEHSLDMRYEAQEYTLTIPAGDPLADAFVKQIAQRFHDAHDARYGHSNPGAPVEFVTARTALLGELGRAAPEQIEPGVSAHRPSRDAVFGRQSWDTAVISRSELADALSGPAIVDEQTATTVVPPGWTLHVDALGTLMLTKAGEDV
jgi:N-methylhydantoinase A